MRKMMKVFVLTVALLAIGSCKKNEISGCMDSNSDDYNSVATKDDGSCTFSGRCVFYYKQASATEMVDDGISSLKYYVDGALVGSTASSVYFTSASDCGANGSITVEKSLGFVKGKSFTYKIVDQTEDVIFEGVLNIDANTCHAVELVY